MQVGPEDRPADAVRGVQQVMVIVPIDPKVNETEDITQEHGEQRLERGEGDAVRHFQLEHHDRDDDRQHAIAERLESAFGHAASLQSSYELTTKNFSGPSEEFPMLDLWFEDR